MTELATIEISHNSDKLIIESEPEKLGQFISGLLGKPQKIKRKIEGVFDIKKNHITNIIDTITQRIAMQNKGNIVSFRGEVFFEDNFVRTIDSIDAFKHLEETKKLRSIAVDISISFLIKFPSKQTAEKQTINIIFSENSSAYFIPYMAIKNKFSSIGSIYYEIENTERTWADDIDNLLRNECHLLIDEETFFIKHQSKIINGCGFISASSLLTFPIYFIDKSQTKIKNTISESINNFPSNFESINQSIDQKASLIIKLYEYSTQMPNNVGIQYLPFFFASIFLIAYFSALAEKRKKSYITIGETSERYRVKSKKKEGFFKTKLFLSFFINIFAGIVASYVFARYLS